ncbi:hypothetical protein [Streptomyces sp. NBC_00829]|uniref:hypothetical protein n=1 Tax=Streptomyces sp. NBC_00829 TaxID=2903679 RepID=UPI0038667347|nr:hypothetical protein OG293_33590 [Streptomyces sp. NBC_00829]
MPRAVARGFDRFGPFGSPFVLLSRLTGLFAVVTVTVALGQVLSWERAVMRRLSRTGSGRRPSG